MKKILMIVLVVIFITGCTNYTELNDLAIINSMGIEKIDNKYKITISVIDVDNYKNDNNYEKNIYTSSDYSIEKAINNLYLQLDKTIYLSHLDNLVLNKNLNKKDFNNIINYFLTNNENRNTFNLILLKDYNIETVLNDKDINLKELIITNNKNQGIQSEITYEDFLRNTLSNKKSFIPTITYNNKLQVEGYSIYKDKVYTETISKKESIIYNIITNKITNLNLEINKDLTLNIKNLISNLNTGKITYLNISSTISIITNKNNLDNDKIINTYNFYLKKKIESFNKKYKYLNKYKLKLNSQYINNTNIKGYD